MGYRFFHNWQYEPGKEEHNILEAAVALSLDRDKNFLREVAAFISEHTGARYVIIGRLSDDSTHVHTCAFLRDNQALENITYSLQGTPCDAVLIQRFCYFPNKVSQHFPDDKELRDLEIDSYLGSIFLADTNEPVGLIALMDDKPMKNVAFAEHLILVLSPAIEEELISLKSV